MKTIVKYLISLLITLSCACADQGHEDFGQTSQSTVSIAHLKTLCRQNSVTITDDIYVEAYIVANDLYGEYTKAIVVSDNQAGIEIAIDSNNTAKHFPISAGVVVNCCGLTLGNRGGSIILGTSPNATYTVGRIKEQDISRYFLVERHNPKAITPTEITIPSLNPSHIGSLVVLSDVTFNPAKGQTWCNRDPESGKWLDTSHTLLDKNNNTLELRINSDCEYRSENLPTGYGTVWGIIEYFNGTYSLRIVNHRIEFPDNTQK